MRAGGSWTLSIGGPKVETRFHHVAGYVKKGDTCTPPTLLLSKREIQVASHLFSGLTNAEIGEKLFIGETTVKKHLQSIYAKVGVKNRTSLINKMLPG